MQVSNRCGEGLEADRMDGPRQTSDQSGRGLQRVQGALLIMVEVKVKSSFCLSKCELNC